MNIGDIETFYPMQAGGLESSSFFMEESRATGDDLDDSQDDQESVEFEETDATEAGGVSDAEMPTFRQLVKAKKLELKAQYGKGRFRIGECGVKPFRENVTKYNPIVRIGESRTCISWGVSCDKKCLGVCCGPTTCKNWAVIPGNTQAYDNASERFSQDLAAWNSCEKGWIPGWRKQWRIFKKSGGLAQLKMKSQGLLTPQEQAAPPPPVNFNGYSCSQLISEFNIIPGKSFGTAPADAITAWRSKKCIGPTGSSAAINKPNSVPNSVQRTSGEEDDASGSNKKMFIFGAIALVVIIAIILIIMVVKSKKTS